MQNDINNILKLIAEIVGNAPPSLNTLGKLSDAISKEPQLYNILIAMINTKFPSSGIVNYYTKQEVQHIAPKLDRQCTRYSRHIKRGS